MHKTMTLCTIAAIFLSVYSFAAVPRDGETIQYIKLRDGDIVSDDLNASEVRSILQDAYTQGQHAMIRFTQIPTPGDRTALEALGITLLQYIPYRAWVVGVTGIPSENDISSYGMAWAMVWSSEYKISEPLNSRSFDAWAEAPNGQVYILTSFHGDVDTATAEGILGSLGVSEFDRVELLNMYVHAIEPDSLDALSVHGEVFYMDQVGPALEPCLANSRQVINADELESPPYGLSGIDIDVMVWESGVVDEHENLAGRVYVENDIGPCETCDDNPVENYHSTFVGGIIGSNHEEHRGLLPNGEIFSYCSAGGDLFNNPYDLEQDVNTALSDSYHDPVEIVNISMNIKYPDSPDEFGVYEECAQLSDQLSIAHLIPIVWAAGNNGDNTTGPSIGVGAIGKNTITVGAVNALDPNNIHAAYFTGIGPTDDGRIKPDICAPGVGIMSTECENGFAPRNGTSYATPLVVGSAGLLIEKYKLVNSGATANPALIKALLVSTARDYGPLGPDFEYGFGMVNLKPAVDIVANGDCGEITVPGTSSSVEIPIEGSFRRLSVAVSWLDLAASRIASVDLVNDIDVYLESPSGLLYYPYNGVGGSTGVDIINNVEHVVVFDPESDSEEPWLLHIEASDLPEDNDGNPSDDLGQTCFYSIFREPHITYENISGYVDDHKLDYSGTPYSAVAWNYEGDVNPGHIDDLFVALTEYDSVIYRGFQVSPSGIPRFEELEPEHYQGLTLPPPGLRGLAYADMNNDGVPEMFAAHESTPKLYRWNSALGKMFDLSISSGLAPYATNSTAGAWGNYDGDNFIDLFVCRAEGYIEDPPQMDNPRITPLSLLLQNSGGDGFTHVQGSGISNQLSSACATWGDYDEDGNADLFVGAFTVGGGGSQLYKNRGNGTFTNVTGLLNPNPQVVSVNGCLWADVNGDSYDDLILSHFNGQIEIYCGTEGGGEFNNGTEGPAPYRLGSVSGYSGMAVFDYNLDGRNDILGLSQNQYAGPDLFDNRGAMDFFEVGEEVGLRGVGGQGSGYIHGAVVADLGNGAGGEDLDGLPDLFFGRPVASNEFLYLSRYPGTVTPHYVKIRTLSESSTDNRMGIGARVNINASGQICTQIVDGGSMRGGQASRDLTFGLGAFDGSVTATVTWPSGVVQSDVPLLLDRLNVIELAPLAIDDPTVVGTYLLQAGGLADWRFSWCTNTVGDPDYDWVIFDMASIPYECQPDFPTINVNTSDDVDLTVEALEGGGYKHVLVWSNRACVPTCNIGFWVSSGSVAQADTSDTLKSLQVKICGSF